ncbi:hypothetical protein J7M00_02285 [bacterium]|nr:hypothetical protein [bacterium]
MGQPSVQSAQRSNAQTSSHKISEWSPNPTTSAFLSAAFPGAGQIYSRAYWHAPFFIAAEGFFLWRAAEYWTKADDMWNERNSLTPGTDEYYNAENDFENFTNERNTYLWLFAGTKFLDIVDAYVSAHLYHFDEHIEAPITAQIIPLKRGAKISLSFRF